MIFVHLFHTAGGNYVVGCAMGALCKASCICSGTYVSLITLCGIMAGRASATIALIMMLADGSTEMVKVLDFWHPMTSVHQALLLPGGACGQHGYHTKTDKQGQCLQPSLKSRGGAINVACLRSR